MTTQEEDLDKNTSNKKSWLAGLVLAGIILIGLLLRLSYLRELISNPSFSHPQLDAAFHDYWARGLVTGDWTVPDYFSDPEIRQSPFIRPPGYPMFLAFVYALSGCSYLAARMAQMGLGLINCVLAYFLGRSLYGRGTGLIVAAFMAVYWVFIYFEGELLAPVLIITLSLILMHILRLWWDKFTFFRAFSAGAVLGLSALVRTNILLFGPVVLYWSWRVARRRNDARHIGMTWLGFMLGAATVIAPATIRNYSVAHDLVLITSNAGINLYAGNNEKANGAFPKLPILKEMEDLEGWNNFDYARIAHNVGLLQGREMKHSEVSAYFTKKAIDYIRRHPIRILRLMAIKTALFWGPVTVSNNMEIHYEKLNSPTLRHIPGFPVVISLAIVGLIQLFVGRKRQRDQSTVLPAVTQRQFEISLLVLLFIVTYFISFLPFFVVERFRVPIIPFLFLFGAYGLYRIGRLLASGSWYGAVSWSVIGFVLFIAASRPVASYRPDLARWHFLRGNAFKYARQLESAINEFREAVRLRPDYVEAHYNLGSAWVDMGKLDEAIGQYTEALQTRPDSAKVHNNLGFALAAQGKLDEAIINYSEALEIRPDYAKAHNNLGVSLAKQGKTDEAIRHFSEALRIKPDFVEANVNRKTALAAQEKINAAIAKLQQAIKGNPKDPELHYRLGGLYQRKGKLDQAIKHYKAALSVHPGFTPALNKLATVYTIVGDYEKAVSAFNEIIELHPDNVTAPYNIACIYARQNRTKESLDWLKKAVNRGYDNWDLIMTDKDLENIRDTSYYKDLIKRH